ncbi:hypothetical protein Brsp05_04622 [Brucella sp. NBRC 12953]
MEEDGRKGPGRGRPANDNHSSGAQNAEGENDGFARLDAVVLAIARLSCA